MTDEGSSKILLCADAGNVSLRQMRENIVCHAAAVGCFLHHEHTSRLAAGRFDGRPVDRGDRPQLQNFGRQPILFGRFRRLEHCVDHRSVGNDGAGRSLFQARFFRVFPVSALAASGIAHSDGTRVRQDSLSEHHAELGKACRAVNLKPRHLPEVGHVEDAVVRLAVGPDEARPVHAEHHMELLEGDIL